MKADRLPISRDELTKLWAQDKYVSHKAAADVADRLAAKLPAGLWAYVKLVIQPAVLLEVLKLRSLLVKTEVIRIAHNDAFVEKELIRRADFFDNIEGHALDEQQRRTVVTDEDNSLVIAGAGSGKTLTIVAKVQYLLQYQDVQPESILPISFTKKSAEDMTKRINVPGVKPQTFHKFGLTALERVEGKRPAIFDGANVSKLYRSFLEDLTQDPVYLEKLATFFLHYIKIPRSEFEFETLGDYIQYLKDQNFTTYKSIEVPYRGKQTFRNEIVKSIQECVIANFLLFNRVEYAYEAPYSFPIASYSKTRYNPDFTIDTGNEKIYLEHFGVDRDQNVPKFFAGPGETYEQARSKYISGINWKRQTHTANNTKLIETYSYEFTEGNLEENLRSRLLEAGVSLSPMTPKEMWEVIQESAKDEVDGFVDLVGTFLALLKSNQYSMEDIARRNQTAEVEPFLKTRGERFLELFEPIYDLYEHHLQETGQIDFNDMISRATNYIESGRYHCPLDYVIVDEFQDLSIGRYKILAAIRKQNPNVKLYCVGDDWQSIYRFAGSDIALFRDFEEYFGYTAVSKIETTYRFNNPLVATTSDFILKNPNQTEKHLKSPANHSPTFHSIIESDGSEDDTNAFVQAVRELSEQGMKPGSKVYAIGRYNFDIKRLRDVPNLLKVDARDNTIRCTIPSGLSKGKVIKIEFVTAHRSKGLEADYTIMLNCNSGKYGFPSGKADDPLLNLLLSSADQYENGEERRLFYVALTRTKNHVVLITDRNRKSKFIKELQDNHEGRSTSCPACGKGDVVRRSGAWGVFYGCSNYAYGCTYVSKKPPEGMDTEAATALPAARVADDMPTVDLDFHEVEPKEPKHKIHPGAVGSKLSKSESNRFAEFIKKPRQYAVSQKARDKVADLQMIEYKLTASQKQHFADALDRWRGELRQG
jgi:DNA helicase-4